MGGNEIERPPRWADALLRTCLGAEEAETESGDLLEAYRDSIYPKRGRWLANLWYLRQVFGYVLRAKGMKLRNWLSAGLALCMFTTAVSLILYPGLRREVLSFWPILGGGFLLYGYAIVSRTRAVTPQDADVLRLGTQYGIAIGVLQLVGVVGLNLRVGASWLLVLLSFALPLAAGAHGGIKLWRISAGIRVGFWSGLISGMIMFLGLMAFGYILAFIPGIPGAEFPANHPYTAAEYQQANVGDTLGGGFFALFVFGGLLSWICGTVGSLAGLLAARTGKSPSENARILWTILAICILGAAR